MRTQPSQIDLSRYQTADLADRVAQLISVSARLRTIVSCGALCLISSWIVVTLACSPHVHWGVLTGLLVYSSLAALVLGVLLGLLIVLNCALDNLVELFDISLSITDQAVGDLDGYRNGDLCINTAQLLHSVHDDVLLPTIKKVIYRQSQLLGKLLFPVYRASIGKLTKRVLSCVCADDSSPADSTEHQPEEPLPVSSNNNPDAGEVAPVGVSDRSRKLLQRAHGFVTLRGHQLRRTVIIPLSVLLGLAFALAVVPLAVTLVFVVAR